MPQIAGFRGALWAPGKVELAAVAAAPIDGVKDRLARGELVRDATRALYRYHQTFAHRGRSVTRKATIAAAKLLPWSEGMIRPHEATDAKARDAARAAIAAAGAHTQPVVAGYRDAALELDRLMRGPESDRPALEVTTADGTVHRLWRVSSAEIIGKVRPLFAPKKLHVLEGHARYEAMLAHAETLGSLPMYSSGNYGLACLINVEDPALVVAARHRIVRGAAKRDAVLEAATKYFLVEKLAGAAKDLAKQEAALAETVAHQPAAVVTFAGDADAYKLTLSPDVSPVAEGVAVHRALQKYDPVVVEHLVLGRAMPGVEATPETDAAAVLRAVEAGADAGVLTRALAINEILHVDELGQTLPPGSTAFPPAVANLVAYLVEPDEDLV